MNRMIVIDAASPVPPFEQLRAQLARQIQDHTLAVGTRLPTIRRLAADLGLAVNTVGRAYRELEEAGLIETRGSAGSFVSAAGEKGRERASRAAADYAAVIASLGIDTNEAIRIVQAALTKGIAVSPATRKKHDMAVPHSLPQRIFLLAYNPDKGRVGLGTNLGAMLRAAALADLYRGGHLTDERGRAAIDVRYPCHDPVLDALLEEIAGSKPRTWQSWIGHRQRATFRAVRQQLNDGGWVRLEPHKILGLFPTTKVTIRDLRVREELLDRVNTALHKPIGSIDAADAALVAIIAAGDLKLVLDRKTKRANKPRIQELSELSGPIVPALHKSIEAAAVGEV